MLCYVMFKRRSGVVVLIPYFLSVLIGRLAYHFLVRLGHSRKEGRKEGRVFDVRDLVLALGGR